MSNHGAPNLAHPKARWGVTRGNPVWDEIDAIVAMCPPQFLLNVTLDSARGVTGVFAGDMTPAVRRQVLQLLDILDQTTGAATPADPAPGPGEDRELDDGSSAG